MVLIISPTTQQSKSCLTAYDVAIIGAGLAGSEAALTCAAHGLSVVLFEMRPTNTSPAHSTKYAAELVCSNSFKSIDPSTAAGLLKSELSVLGSKLLEIAYHSRVPAGAALAVDREVFSRNVEAALEAEKLITIERREITSFDEFPSEMPVIVAAGPLTSEALAQTLLAYTGGGLSFFDAAAPIVLAESLDTKKVFYASRYGKGEGSDYLNASMDKEQYDRFYQALIEGERTISREFETRDLFQGCQPVEEVARKGYDALRYGALKPVGIDDPVTGRWPFALVQLRRENREGTAYNLVGFQTNLKWPEQKRIFSLIPGLENAEFVRFGVMHKNTFIDAPRVLNPDFSLKSDRRIFCAGQIMGTEGYTEAIASGLMCALNVVSRLEGLEPCILPRETAFGALLDYAFNPETIDYQPMHVNFGVVPPLDRRIKNKRHRYRAYALRSMAKLYDVTSTCPTLCDSEAAQRRVGEISRQLEEMNLDAK